MRRPALVAALALAVSGSVAASAAAGLWSTVGGDAGRSGFQPLGAGTAPYTLLWDATSPTDQGVVTSVIVSGAAADGTAPRAIYGTSDGRIHLRDLYTGEPVGDPLGVAAGLHANRNAFTGYGGSVTPVESSADGALGQVFAVVNDRSAPKVPEGGGEPEEQDAIAIAQVDERSGRLVQTIPVTGTAEMVASSTPLLSEPTETGDRSLVFVATDTADWAHKGTVAPKTTIYRVPIKAAHTDRAVIDVENAEAQEVPALNPLASPSLITASDNSGQRNGRLTTYVTVSTHDPDAPLQTAAIDGLSTAGPQSGKFEGETAHYVFAQTVSVPVARNGRPPGTFGSRVGRAPALLVASYEVDVDKTVVHRLVPSPDGSSFVEAARSERLPGLPAPGLATTQDGVAPGDSAGQVIVTTGRNVYSLDGGDLSAQWKLDPGDGLTPGDTGFSHTSAAVAGGVVFLSRDNGRRLALRASDGVPLGSADFDDASGASVSVSAYGAPAATAAGIVLFASDKGVFALRNRCGNDLAGTSRADELYGTLAGDTIDAGAGSDTVDGRPGDDCIAGGDGDDVLAGDGGDDRVDGGAGNDRLLGGEGADTLTGNAGDDRAAGGDGNDVLDGGFGGDVLKGGGGADRAVGGDGDDRLYGDATRDVLSGGAGDDRLYGGSGNDRLRGGPGRDLIFGGGGNDVLTAGRGGGTIAGGRGNDRIAVRNRSRDVVHCGAGRDTVRADRADRLDGCERISRR